MVAPRRVSTERLVELVGDPSPIVAAKIRPRLDDNARRFIARSPLLFLATSNASGAVDCSPRGDPPGFVHVLDDTTLVIPDRPGNRLARSSRNIVDRAGVGLLFVVPGMSETLRVNGRAYLTDEPELLANMRVNERRPKLATVVEVAEVYIHCGRALLRSRTWDPDAQRLADDVPSVGAFLAAAASASELPAAGAISREQIDEDIAAAYRELY